MTAPYYGFLNTPAYQRKIAQLNRQQREILNTMLVDEDEAEREIKNQLALMELGQREKTAEKGLALEERKITAQSELGKQELSLTGELKGKALTQELQLGRERMATQKNIAEREIGSKAGIEEAGLAFEEKQYPWKLGLGLADVAAGGVLGYAKMRRDIQTAESLDAIRRRLYGGS